MDDREGRGPRSRQVEVPGLSPVRAFLVVCTIATVLGTAFLATRDASPSEPPPPAAPRTPDYSLTDAEAIAEFERLNAQLMTAYEERNIALAEDVFTSDSPMLPRVRKEINTLIDEQVLSKTEFRVSSLEVIRNTSEEVVLERVQVVYPRFETEHGEDVTGTAKRERQRSEWTLRLQSGRWLLYNATITRIYR